MLLIVGCVARDDRMAPAATHFDGVVGGREGGIIVVGTNFHCGCGGEQAISSLVGGCQVVGIVGPCDEVNDSGNGVGICVGNGMSNGNRLVEVDATVNLVVAQFTWHPILMLTLIARRG